MSNVNAIEPAYACNRKFCGDANGDGSMESCFYSVDQVTCSSGHWYVMCDYCAPE